MLPIAGAAVAVSGPGIARMLLGFDCETSGLPKPSLDPNDPAQPHLVQLGAKLYDRDWKIVGRQTVLIRPEGWEIEPDALAVHGIPTHRCQRYGIRLDSALLTFRDLVEDAARIVAHNAQFDRKVITTAIQRAGGEGLWWAKKAAALFCTMEAATEVCQLPGEYGLKFPSLEEAIALLLPGQDYPIKHDADADIDAAIAVYRELVRRGIAAEVDPFARAA